jgi:hypothetical protein
VSPEGKLWLPEAIQWKILKTLHQLYHLGLDNILVLVKKMFGRTKLRDMAKQVERDVKHAKKKNNNPNNKRYQVPGAQRQGSYPGEDWQLPGDQNQNYC